MLCSCQPSFIAQHPLQLSGFFFQPIAFPSRRKLAAGDAAEAQQRWTVCRHACRPRGTLSAIVLRRREALSNRSLLVPCASQLWSQDCAGDGDWLFVLQNEGAEQKDKYQDRNRHHFLGTESRLMSRHCIWHDVLFGKQGSRERARPGTNGRVKTTMKLRKKR